MMNEKNRWLSLIEFLDENQYWNYIEDQSKYPKEKQVDPILLSRQQSIKFHKLLVAIHDYENG